MMDEDRKKFIREQAIAVQELTKGFNYPLKDNAMKTLLEFTDYILELTNNHKENQ